MMGLLDFRFSQDPEKEAAIRRGLLDFGLNMMAQGGKSTGQAIGNSGLLSLQANQQREGSAQRAALHKAQMDEYKAQAGQRTAQTEEAQRKARRDEEFRRSLGGGTQSMQPDQAVSPGALTNWSAIGAPQGQQGAIDYRALAASYPEKIEQIKALAEAGNFGRQEVARTLEEGTPTGGKQTVSFDKYGGRVGAPVSGYVPPQLVDLGDRKVFTTPKEGAEFRPGLSPSDLTSRRGQDIGANTTRRGQDMTNERARELNSNAAAANEINREAQQSQIINDPNIGPVIVNKGTKTATRATMDGQPVPGEETVKGGKRAANLLSQIEDARALLPKATGSGVGAAADKAAGWFGATPKGAEEASRLATISGWMVSNVPRMEGPQSNFDVQNYQQMAAQVGDATVPVKRRLAALDQLETLQRKYAHLNGGGAPAAAPSAKKPTVSNW